MPSIDDLYIDIQANAVKANDSIDKLISKVGGLSASLSGLNASSLTGLANGVQRLSTSMQSLKSVGTADFTRLARNLNNIGTVNTTSLNRLASSVNQIGKSFQGLKIAESGIKTIADLANGIKQLGYASSTKAIDNIPRLAVAMRQLMTELSKAPAVSQNLIQMTNALANLSRTGGSAGTAANSLIRSFNNVPSSTKRATSGFKGLASAIGKVYATYWLLFRAFRRIGQAMELASNLTEVENVIDHTFGSMRTKLDDFTQDSIDKFGLAELAAKQYAGRFQAMGVGMGISNNAVAKSTEFLNAKLGDNAKIYGDLGNSMADMSINLTKLTSDYASFFDVAQSDVAEDFQSIFTGQTKPLRTYGLDLTNATLSEWALNNGLDANIKSMTQAEKAMLRYQYVVANSSHIMGDFARTSDTWHNTMTRLKNNLQTLGTTLGRMFINLLKPLVVFVNNAIVGFNKVAVAVENALGKLLGWEYEKGSGGFTADYEDAADYADDMADSTGKATKAAKELKKQLQGIDELNVLNTNNDNDTSPGNTSNVNNATTNAVNQGTDGSWVQRTGMWETDVKTWYDLGKKISDGLKTAMDSIKWNEIYKKAGNFGKDLADFINGLFAADENGNTVFGSIGKTIAGALKTAIIFAFTLGKGINFEDIGHAIADFFNKFNEEMNSIDPVTGMTGWEALAETLNTWVDGIKTTIVTAIKDVKWTEVIKGAFDFAKGLELDTLAIIIGAFVWKHGGKAIVAGSLQSLLSTQIATGIGEGTIALDSPVSIGLIIGAAVIGWKIGTWLYENTNVSSFADAVAEWMVTENGDISITKLITVTLTGLTVAIPVAKIGGKITAALTGKGLTSAIAGSSIASTIGTTITTALTTDLPLLFGAGTFAEIGVAIVGGLGGAVLAAIGGWKLGSWIYDHFSEEIDSVVFAIGDFFTITIPNFFTQTLPDALSGFVSSVGTWFTDNVINPIKDTFETLKTGIVDLFSSAWDGVKNIWNKVTGWFKTYIVTPVSNLFTSLKTSIKDAFSTAWDAVKSVWDKVKGWFDTNILKPISNIFTSLKTNVTSAFSNAWDTIKGVWDKVTDWFSNNIFSPISNIFTSLKTNIGDAFSNAWNSISDLWSGAKDWFDEHVVGKIKGIFDKLTSGKDSIVQGFKDAYNGIKDAFSGIADFFKGIANKIMQPIGKAINGVKDGLNWLLDKVGSAKDKLTPWTPPPFAKGTSGLPKDTLGMVNDQKGSTYREMIVPPNGKPFIPEGRNVILPMKKGTKIMPANQTKAFMNGIPRFEGGIGDVFSGIAGVVKSFTGDVMDYLSKPADAVKIALGKFVSIDDSKRSVADIAKGAVNKVFDGAVGFVKKIFDSTTSAKVENAIKWAVGIANNNAHGYDQGSRWGNPDYDCSSLVISAFEQAGIKLKSSGATYTGNMMSAAFANGFKNVISSVNLGNAAGMKRGDILLNQKHHTAIYLGKGQIVQASSNEYGSAKGGKPGDQTGREIAVRGYYNFPWDAILRFSGKKFAKGFGKITPMDFGGYYAAGGFPDRGTMFVAGEAGTEAVAHINGRTEVLNQSQMARVMYDAVTSANAQQNALLQQQNDYLYQLLQKETGISYKDVFEATRKGAEEYQMINGRPAFI